MWNSAGFGRRVCQIVGGSRRDAVIISLSAVNFFSQRRILDLLFYPISNIAKTDRMVCFSVLCLVVVLEDPVAGAHKTHETRRDGRDRTSNGNLPQIL